MSGSLYVDYHELLAIIMTGLWFFSTFPRDRGMSLLGHISGDCACYVFPIVYTLIVVGCLSNTSSLQGGAYLKLGINSIISGIRSDSSKHLWLITSSCFTGHKESNVQGSCRENHRTTAFSRDVSYSASICS